MDGEASGMGCCGCGGGMRERCRHGDVVAIEGLENAGRRRFG